MNVQMVNEFIIRFIQSGFDFFIKYTNLVYCALGMAVPKLYWKVLINGKWTFRKAHFYREPKEWEFTHEIVPYREEV